MGNTSSTPPSLHHSLDDTLYYESSNDSEDDIFIFQNRNQYHTTAALSKTSHVYSYSIPNNQTTYKSQANIHQNYEQTYIIPSSTVVSAQPNSSYNTRYNNNNQPKTIVPPSISFSAQPNLLYNTVNSSDQQRTIAPTSSASSVQSSLSTFPSNVQNQTPIKNAPKSLNVINPKKITSSKSTQNSSIDAKIVNCSKRSGICLKFLKGSCEYGSDCRFLHNNRPYLWAYRYHKTWYKCSDQHDVEDSYCDPLQDSYSINFNPSGNSIQQDIIFKDDGSNCFTCNDYAVYRFSTPSYGSTKRKNCFHTKWLWYWKINDFFWNELSLESGCSISSRSFEKAFFSMESDFIEYTINTVPFQLNFCSFQQIDLETGKYWDIRRRPKKLTAADKVQVLQNKVPFRSTNTLPISIAKDFWGKPVQWKTTGEDPKQYLQKIFTSHWEFHKVKRLMKKTIPGVYIKSLHRIENNKLNQNFSLKRHQMISDLTENHLNERLLFHGCPESCIDSICHQGFDFRLSGDRTGTLYGRGAYFASKASYSHNYCEVNAEGYQRMFIAKVLVGCSVLGKPGYVRPPSINGGNELYNSCVDNQNSPTIFVIFDFAQAYPQYLVTYSWN